MEHLTQLFIDAGILMLTGMVFVFAFLGLLVIFINNVLLKLANAYPDPIIQSKRPARANNAKVSQQGVSPSIVAAISSAVSQYRQQHRKK
ncbi:hypothetical protein tinsulaeT_29800 [Thalassotalea insulae]|uniref:Probable oxaloacetate decarboxylase gamma chain n=1 Tax=Thalassotalea insulae TaxID=2056778 RepID=A0ABQ6GY04_9GAMM|nr:OadG family transporter subunit [Thalassotalea insulae]GLX79640.1 hypothetical protein tinsulaeT_29800 [Thalassotalea insulae]